MDEGEKVEGVSDNGSVSSALVLVLVDWVGSD